MPGSSSRALTVAEVYAKYLLWIPGNRSARMVKLTEKYLPSFLEFLPAGLLARELKPFHIREWIDKHPAWKANQRRAVISYLTRPINWAEEEGYPGVDRIRVKRPAKTRRQGRLTAEIFKRLLALLEPHNPFRDLVLFSWECGCRPQEGRLVEAKQLNLERQRIEIPPEQAKGHRGWFMLYLSPLALSIVQRLSIAHPEGKIFRNTKGRPWTVSSVDCRFKALVKKLGVKIRMYDFRHAFATEKLRAGHNPVTVAKLMNHVNAAMILEHYEELTRDEDHLRQAVQRIPTNE